MAGVNLLKQLKKEEGAEVAASSAGLSLSLGSGGALADLSSYQKVKLVLIFGGFFVYSQGRSYFNETYLPEKLVEPQAQVEQLDQEIAAARTKLRQNDEIARAADAIQEQISALQRDIQTVERVKKSNRDKVVRMVDFIMSKMPEPIWVSDLRLEARGGSSVDLKGYSTTYQTISTYFSRLEDAVFFENWQLIQSSRSPVKDAKGNDITASQFELRAQVRDVP